MIDWLYTLGQVLRAYDSGGVTTSTVTVPLVTALGLGPGACGNSPGAQPHSGWLWPDRFCQPASHDDGNGLRATRRVAGATEAVATRQGAFRLVCLEHIETNESNGHE